MGRAAGVLQAPSTVHLFSFRILPRIFRSTKAESERAGSRSTAETWPFLPRFLGETVDNPVARGEESGKNTLLQASLATISHNGISERCRLEIRLESLLAVECHVGDTACGFHGRKGEAEDGFEIGRGVVTERTTSAKGVSVRSMQSRQWNPAVGWRKSSTKNGSGMEEDKGVK